MNKVILALFGIVALASALNGSHPVLTRDFVNHINSVQGQWVATHDNQFNNMTIDQVKGMLGIKLRKSNFPKVSYANIREFISVPDSFDARKQWGDCIHPIRDQARCGSCWAFGAAESHGDRHCILNGVKGDDSILSTQMLVSCDDGNYGCDGGYLDETWDWIVDNGLVTESCWPYSSQSGKVEKCQTQCKGKGDWKPVKGKNARGFDSKDDAKTDIMTNGPLETGFEVYQDFMSYKSGIYRHTSGGLLGGHAVKVLGWGVEGGVKYWIAANSWTANWGENGYFRIQEGQCGFDDEMIVADPVA